MSVPFSSGASREPSSRRSSRSRSRCGTTAPEPRPTAAEFLGFAIPAVTTAGVWLLGLAVFLGVTMPLWQPGQNLALTILIGILGGLVMAAATSAVTGVALRRLPGLA